MMELRIMQTARNEFATVTINGTMMVIFHNKTDFSAATTAQ